MFHHFFQIELLPLNVVIREILMPDSIGKSTVFPVHSGMVNIADMSIEPGYIDHIAAAVTIGQVFVIIRTVSILPPAIGRAAVELNFRTGGNFRKDNFLRSSFNFRKFLDIGLHTARRMNRISIVPDHSIDIPYIFILGIRR